MKPASTFLPPLSAVLVTLAVAGCAQNFYLSESEVAAYGANLRTEASANDLLSHFANQRIQIEFAAGPTPTIRSTNILEVLRAIPELFFLEQGFRQIRLDRLSRQIEEQLDAWIAERLYLLLREGGDQIKLEQLERVNVVFLAPPVLAYQPERPAATFDLRVRVQMTGTLWVRLPVVPDGHHRLTLTIDNYRLRGSLEVSPLPVGVAFLRLVVNPQPGSVSVQGTGPDRLKREMGQRLAAELSSPVDETRSLSYDNFALPRVTLARTQGQTQLEVAYRPRPEVEDPVLDVVARGADGNLYHSRRERGIWGAAVPIPMGGPFAGNPALVASGPDQLDVVTVAPTGELVYAGWRNGAWGNIFRTPTVPPAPLFRAHRPALVATAPGQLEVIAVGRDYHLYHLRRLNGRWEPPSLITDTARWVVEGNPVAIQVGQKIVLLFTNITSYLFVAAFDLETRIWGQAQAIQIPPTAYSPVWGPAAASCEDGRVTVVYAFGGGPLSQIVLDVRSVNFVPGVGTTGLLVGLETSIGPAVSGHPGLTCSGYRRMELLVRAADGRLVHNHYSPGPVGLHDGRTISEGWQGREDASERFFGTVFPGRVAASLSVASTRAGQVHLTVAQEQPPSSNGGSARQPPAEVPRRIFHNSYDATRFGYAPWKAVHWRGMERISTFQFLGAPALALWDRQLQFAVVGNNGNIWHSSLVDYGLARFSGVPGSAVRFLFDPIVLSSGPGTTDVLYAGADGRPGHVRRQNAWSPRNVRLDLPPGRTINSPLVAVGFGSGQVEAVAVANDQTLYHWRHRNGRWEPPVQIPGTVISAPILVNTGAGQLELFAIGGDQRLYHWRFRNAQWENPRQIPSPFALNAVLFGPQAASSWGDGMVDIVVVEAWTNRMFHRRIWVGAETSARPTIRPLGIAPPGFQEVGGTAADVPALTAFGPARLNILVRGADGRLYTTWGEVPSEQVRGLVIVRRIRAPPIRWGALAPVSQPGLALLLGGAVRLGEQELAALAVDRSGKLHFCRFTRGRWSGFLPLQRQTAEVQHGPPLIRPAIAAH